MTLATPQESSASHETSDLQVARHWIDGEWGRVSREIQAGTVWTNVWAALNDGFAEGGYKQSGVGRLRGRLAISDFQEAKTVVHSVPPLDR